MGYRKCRLRLLLQALLRFPRTKAKAATCYSKKTGCFLPQHQVVVSPYFKLEYHDKITYFELTDEFIDNETDVKAYVMHVLSLLLMAK